MTVSACCRREKILRRILVIMSEHKEENLKNEEKETLDLKDSITENWEREKEAVNLFGDEDDVPSFIEENEKNDDFGVELEEDAEIKNDNEDGYDLDDEHHVSVDMSALEEKKEKKDRSEAAHKKVEELVEKGLVDKKRLIAPIALIILLIAVIIIGVTLSHKNSGDANVANETAASASSETASPDAGSETVVVPDTPLTACTDDAINNLVLYYYTAYATGDTATISTLVDPVTDDFLTEVKTRSQYIDSYPSINTYLKPGPQEGSYLAYVEMEVRMTGYNMDVPALQALYICKRADGTYYVNRTEELSEADAQYIHDIDLQEDVIELNNKVTVNFNNKLVEDAAFASYYNEVYGQMKAEVSQALSEDHSEADTTPVETYNPKKHEGKQVKATAVVNMRASDSENADKLGKAQIGDLFTVIEERENGWTNVKASDGSEVWIKSDYLELLEPDTEEEDTTAQQAEEAQQQEQQQTAAQQTTTDNTQYVTTTTRVNVRKTASETADKLATVNEGTKLELIEKQSNGWTKVKYNDTTGFIKSEYLQ